MRRFVQDINIPSTSDNLPRLSAAFSMESEDILPTIILLFLKDNNLANNENIQNYYYFFPHIFLLPILSSSTLNEAMAVT